MIASIDKFLRELDTDTETDIRAKVQQLLRMGRSEFDLPSRRSRATASYSN